MVAGPDGAMYVVDWRTDSGGAGRLWGDGKHGRIYRVTWGGTKDEPALALRGLDSWDAIGKLSDEELLKALARPDAERPFPGPAGAARNAATRTGPHSSRSWLARDQVEVSRYAALGVLGSFWNDDVRGVCVGLLTTGEADLRRLAAEASA